MRTLGNVSKLSELHITKDEEMRDVYGGRRQKEWIIQGLKGHVPCNYSVSVGALGSCCLENMQPLKPLPHDIVPSSRFDLVPKTRCDGITWI
jgi:hypothetical protein